MFLFLVGEGRNSRFKLISCFELTTCVFLADMHVYHLWRRFDETAQRADVPLFPSTGGCVLDGRLNVWSSSTFHVLFQVILPTPSSPPPLQVIMCVCVLTCSIFLSSSFCVPCCTIFSQDMTFFDDKRHTTGALTTRLASDAALVRGVSV